MGDEKEEWGLGNWFGDEEGGVPVMTQEDSLVEKIEAPDLPAIIKNKDVNTFVLPCTSCGKSLPMEATEKGEHICDHCDEIHTINDNGELRSLGIKREKKKKEEKVKSLGNVSGMTTKTIVAVAVIAVAVAVGYMMFKKFKRR